MWLAVVIAAAPAFSFAGAPVAPACVAEVVLSPEPVEPVLKRCGRGKTKREGEVWSSKQGDRAATYRVLGARGPDFVVWWTASTGGSGAFSGVSVLGIERGRLVRRADLVMGDRCNGGVEHAEVSEGVVRVTIDATPHALYREAMKRAVELPARRFVDNAVACAGKLVLEVDVERTAVAFELEDVPDSKDCVDHALFEFRRANPGRQPAASLAALGGALARCD